MTKTTGTLKELNVQEGDVVEFVYSGLLYTVSKKPHHLIHPSGVDAYYTGWDFGTFTLISRANTQPKPWRDLSPEEKGALLLADHEGKVIEVWAPWSPYWETMEPRWVNDQAYRIKPEPKRETITMSSKDIRYGVIPKGYDITFDLVDGEPDVTTIKMEKL
jgi:hypothetical protein